MGGAHGLGSSLPAASAAGWGGVSRPGTLMAPNSVPKWLKQTFDEADKNRDGSLSIVEVLQLLHKLNVNLPRQRVKQMFRVSPGRALPDTTGAARGCRREGSRAHQGSCARTGSSAEEGEGTPPAGPLPAPGKGLGTEHRPGPTSGHSGQACGVPAPTIPGSQNALAGAGPPTGREAPVS